MRRNKKADKSMNLKMKRKVLGGALFLTIAASASGATYYGIANYTGVGNSVKQTASLTTQSEQVTDSTTETTTETTTDSTATDGSSDSTAEATQTTATQGVSAVVENVMPSVVSITCQTQTTANGYYQYGQSQSQTSESAGSGFILDKTDSQLFLATNYHVIEGATQITIGFSDDTTATATVVGTDSTNDLAVVAVNLSDVTADTLSVIKVATLGSSEDLSVGDTVIAIGNALGYGQSVTTGILSAKDREISDAGSSIKFLQTDAAINPGNSGGVLVNSKGEVIGINNAKIEDTSVEGMGYSIPMSSAQPILATLKTGESTDTSTAGTAYLGIYGTTISSDIASVYNIPTGVYVSQIASGSPAEAGGLSAGDVITAFGKTEITSMDDLTKAMADQKSGDKVSITVQRADSTGNYSKKTISVTLTEDTQEEETTQEQETTDNAGGTSPFYYDYGQGSQGTQDNQGSQDGMSGYSIG